MPTQFQSRIRVRRTRAPLPDRVGLAGAVAGLGGGLAMTLIGALLSHALDQDSWLQQKVIASVALGPTVAAQVGFVAGPIIIGVLMHLGLAALLGALFEILMRRIAGRKSNYGLPEVAGLAYGLLIWLAAFFAIIPMLVPLLLQIYAPALLIQHLVYGAVTGLLYSMLRPLAYNSGQAASVGRR
ncbi:MAG: DUF6789 family protein [Roseiflexaceae bacterium]